MCGIFAISSKENIIDDLFLGVFYLQHRGQQYCGLSTYADGKINIRTHRGLVRATFTNDLGGMEGTIGIGHTALKDRQPIKLDSKMGEYTICFEGNVINLAELIDELKKQGHSFYTDSDIEVIAKLIAQGDNFVDGIEKMAAKIRGAYALVILSKGKIYAARDKYAFRPMIIGKRAGAVAISSESCSFENLGFSIDRDVKPGEILEIEDSKYTTVKIIPAEFTQHCAFEWIYTANVASTIDGLSVDIARRNLGAALAKRYPVDVDIVTAVPNSGIGHAIGYAQESKIPFDNAFIKYDYASRSYTQPTQAERDREAKVKLVPVPAKIKDRSLVICDDSIVRGTQMKNDLVVKLRKNGAKDIHVRVACPPLKAPCKYGVATRTKKELAAHQKTVEQVREYINVEGLAYNTLEDLGKALGKPLDQICTSCWTDEYRV
ncbi:MAG: amidophosphoribosyltransferase [Candidatus Margulisbacteria bacterium]|nr:amidophosphoribosyltransferase [Candidatus Margulisiibacteriota bacterium]MBU1021343.1 amidophosphoribosyltransferase [Candidatus Margulisiibacteriota bacterium]MBU1729168.1 amidophosphoribosyltransferase [Candidatus Margulisiibacteriota bacterium]MBU1954841.1 amidophosphoribosyltransferase [Candidatus Margulisiibacteriota bacterium]